MAVGQHLKLRCFLEGIEIPIISADLQVQPDAPSQCTIQIPATDKAHEFRPRTLVHVFFSDFYDGPSDTASIDVGDSPQVGTAEEQADRSIEEEVEEAADNSAPATITAEDIEPTEDIFGEDGL